MGEKINKLLKGEIISSIFYILLGLCLILIPTQTVDVICKVVFGLILIGAGVYHIYIYIRGKNTATILDLLSGVMVFVLGIFLFMTPSIVIKLLPWMLGAFVLVDSLWKLKGAFLLKKGGRGAWSVLLIGSLIFIALGIVILFGNFPKIMTLLIFSGWVLVCNGAADIVFFIIMKLGLAKIAKQKAAEKEETEAQNTQEEEKEEGVPTGKETAEAPQKDTGETSGQQQKTEEEAVEEKTQEPAETQKTDADTRKEEPGKQEDARWEKEPEHAEMTLMDAGKDVEEAGSLKDLLGDSDEEELEEWKD